MRSPFTFTRVTALLAGLIAVLALLVAAPSAPAAPSTSAPVTAKAAANKIDCGESQSSSWCSYITKNIVDNKTIGYRDSITNNRRYAIEGRCEATTTKTSTYTLGASISTEIKAGIFGGVKAEINASVAKSMSTGYSTSATFRIPANSTVYCDRGIVNERLQGYTRLHYCGGGCHSTTKRWTFKAPERLRWWIY